MKQGKIFIAATVIVVVALFWGSCNKPSPSLPLEPISLIQPDSPIVTIFAGSPLPLDIQFTTDRPIDWVLGKYDIDTLVNSTNYVPTYPDTLFFKYLYVNPRSNLYEYKGTYNIPDTLRPFSIIRFKITFLAGSDTPPHANNGKQNYPVGTTSAEKDFTVNVR